MMIGFACIRGFKLSQVSGRAIRLGLQMSTSSAGAGSQVNNMNVVDFHKILKGTDRSKYQIVDVREKDELVAIALAGSDVMNLPLSDASTWSQEVLRGELLDKQKPLLCLCKMGGRSMKAATFFGMCMTGFSALMFVLLIGMDVRVPLHEFYSTSNAFIIT